MGLNPPPQSKSMQRFFQPLLPRDPYVINIWPLRIQIDVKTKTKMKIIFIYIFYNNAINRLVTKNSKIGILVSTMGIVRGHSLTNTSYFYSQFSFLSIPLQYNSFCSIIVIPVVQKLAYYDGYHKTILEYNLETLADERMQHR